MKTHCIIKIRKHHLNALCVLLSLFLSGIGFAESKPEIMKTDNQYQLSVAGKSVVRSPSKIEKPKVLEFDGSPARATTWVETHDGKEVSFFALQRPSGTWTAPKKAEYRLQFQAGSFDPWPMRRVGSMRTC